MTRTTNRTKIGNTRTHVLALAVLTALGVSGLAQAQVEAPRPAAEEEAREDRDKNDAQLIDRRNLRCTAQLEGTEITDPRRPGCQTGQDQEQPAPG